MALPVRRSSRSTPQQAQHWEPLQELEQLHEQMGRLMESVWSPGQGNGGIWMPLADIEETDDAWIIEAELPNTGECLGRKGLVELNGVNLVGGHAILRTDMSYQGRNGV